jgi:hypothetical protein
MTKGDYQVRGCTALLDAIGMAIHKIRKAHHSMNDDYVPEKTMFFIITDGLENASHHYTAGMIKERIEHQKKKHGWEFLFFGANMDAICEAGKIGIDKDHVTSYQADAKGIARSYQQMSYTSSVYRSVDISGRDVDWNKKMNK